MVLILCGRRNADFVRIHIYHGCHQTCQGSDSTWRHYQKRFWSHLHWCCYTLTTIRKTKDLAQAKAIAVSYREDIKGLCVFWVFFRRWSKIWPNALVRTDHFFVDCFTNGLFFVSIKMYWKGNAIAAYMLPSLFSTDGTTVLKVLNMEVPTPHFMIDRLSPIPAIN